MTHRKRLVDDVGDLTYELVARDLDLQIEGLAACTVGDLIDADHRTRSSRELDLRLLCNGTQPHHRDFVRAQVDTLLGQELLDHAIDESLVEIVTTEEAISSGA